MNFIDRRNWDDPTEPPLRFTQLDQTPLGAIT